MGRPNPLSWLGRNSRGAEFSLLARHFDAVFTIWVLKAAISNALIERLLCQ